MQVTYCFYGGYQLANCRTSKKTLHIWYYCIFLSLSVGAFGLSNGAGNRILNLTNWGVNPIDQNPHRKDYLDGAPNANGG